MSDAFSFEGRSVAVLGGASEMGLAVARRFAEAGAAVALGDIDGERLAAHADTLGAEHTPITTAVVDVRDRDAVDGFIASACVAGDRLDVLVNLAGVIGDVATLDIDEAELDRVFAVNVKGVLFACQSAGRRMRAAGAGAIVNTASMGAFTAIPELAAYSMSKAAIVALTRTLARELAGAGVRVNAVAPGYVEGGMTRRHLRDAEGQVDPAQLEEALAKARRRNPLGLTGTGDDIAWACLYLASDAARYVTGQVLHANGGAFMP